MSVAPLTTQLHSKFLPQVEHSTTSWYTRKCLKPQKGLSDFIPYFLYILVLITDRYPFSSLLDFCLSLCRLGHVTVHLSKCCQPPPPSPPRPFTLSNPAFPPRPLSRMWAIPSPGDSGLLVSAQRKGSGIVLSTQHTLAGFLTEPPEHKLS